MRRAKRTIVILSLALAGCSGPVASPTVTPVTLHLRILATTATSPLLDDLVAAYQRPGALLMVSSAAASWETVLNRLLAGEVPYALTTYLPADAGLWAAPVGYDGIAIVVHRSNLVPALTADDLRRLFQGQIAAWSELGGPDLPVVVVSRDAGADTRLVFEALVMGGRRTTAGARLALSSQSVIDIVSRTPGAVGYTSMALADERVRTVPLIAEEGAEPVTLTAETVSGGTYPLRAPLLVVGLAPPAEDSVYRDWFAWMQSEAGQAVVAQRYAALQP